MLSIAINCLSDGILIPIVQHDGHSQRRFIILTQPSSFIWFAEVNIDVYVAKKLCIYIYTVGNDICHFCEDISKCYLIIHGNKICTAEIIFYHIHSLFIKAIRKYTKQRYENLFTWSITIPSK